MTTGVRLGCNASIEVTIGHCDGASETTTFECCPPKRHMEDSVTKTRVPESSGGFALLSKPALMQPWSLLWDTFDMNISTWTKFYTSNMFPITTPPVFLRKQYIKSPLSTYWESVAVPGSNVYCLWSEWPSATLNHWKTPLDLWIP